MATFGPQRRPTAQQMLAQAISQARAQARPQEIAQAQARTQAREQARAQEIAQAQARAQAAAMGRLPAGMGLGGMGPRPIAPQMPFPPMSRNPAMPMTGMPALAVPPSLEAARAAQQAQAQAAAANPYARGLMGQPPGMLNLGQEAAQLRAQQEFLAQEEMNPKYAELLRGYPAPMPMPETRPMDMAFRPQYGADMDLIASMQQAAATQAALASPTQAGFQAGMGLAGPTQAGLQAGMGLAGPTQAGLQAGMGLADFAQSAMPAGPASPTQTMSSAFGNFRAQQSNYGPQQYPGFGPQQPMNQEMIGLQRQYAAPGQDYRTVTSQQIQERQRMGAQQSSFAPQQPPSYGPQQPNYGFGPQQPSGFGPQQPSGFGPQQPSGFGPQQPSGFGPQQPSGLRQQQPMGQGFNQLPQPMSSGSMGGQRAGGGGRLF
jgi:hypothetical protein